MTHEVHLDSVTDLGSVLSVAVQLGYADEMKCRPDRTGREIAEAARVWVAGPRGSIVYREGHLRSLKAAYSAGRLNARIAADIEQEA